MLNTVDDLFIKAVHTVRDLINEDNSSLTFFSGLEKSITKKASGQKQNTAVHKNETMQKKSTKRKFKVPFARKMNKKRSCSNFHQQRW